MTSHIKHQQEKNNQIDNQTNSTENQQKQHELLKRIITGMVLSIIGAALIYFSKYIYVINTAVAFLCVGAVYELYNAAGYKKEYLILILFWAFAIFVSFVKIPYYLNFLIILYPFVIAFFLLLMIFKDRFCKFELRRALIIPSLIVIFLFHSLIDIRQLDNGVYYLTFGILACCFTDIFAFVFGKALGKHKILPKISPKKTWEGSVGGTLSAIILLVVIALILQHFAHVEINFALLILYTFIVSVFSQFGDWSMSIVKRICGIKDYGKIFPGHGGILDRFDSQLIAVPLAYILCALKGFVI